MNYEGLISTKFLVLVLIGVGFVAYLFGTRLSSNIQEKAEEKRSLIKEIQQEKSTVPDIVETITKLTSISGVRG